MENDELEHRLEAALSKYAAVEPRTGLEQRVLATLRAERAKHQERGWWRWGVAVGFALVIIAAATQASKLPKPPHTFIADHTSGKHSDHPSSHATNPTRVPKESKQLASNRGNGLSPKTANPDRRTIRPHAEATMPAQPKLEQFPSPQPLSEQEKILASYVVDYPEHAEFVVQARLEALRKDQEEERKAAAGSINDSQPELNTN